MSSKPQVPASAPRGEGAFRPPTFVSAGEPRSLPNAGDSSLPKVAVIVCHGMGQQVPFETLEALSLSLRDAIARAQSAAPAVTARSVCIGESREPRAEMTFAGRDGLPREAHVYEIYWAPLTEGKVGVRDTVGFLLEGAWNGLWHALFQGAFRRWMFQRWLTFPIHLLWQATLFGGVLLLVLALVLINAIVAAVAASSLIALTGAAWVPGAVVPRFTLDLLPFVASMLAVILGYFIANSLRHRRSRRRGTDRALGTPGRGAAGRAPAAGGLEAFLGAALRALLWPLLLAAMAGCLASAVCILGNLLGLACPGCDLLSGTRIGVEQFLGSLAPGIRDGNPCLLWLTWILAAAASGYIRGLLVQYAGDVAAYVNSNKASKFAEIREAIQDRALNLCRAVYAAKDASGAWFYEAVVIVGHSLGSVIAYDTLNSLVNQAGCEEGASAIASRTPMFLTFGSPLNKIAFVFRTQKAGRSDIREAEAAARQPLIVDYKFRPARWVNIHAWQDIISARLKYFDDPLATGEGAAKKIQDRPDPDARTPLTAHNEYWENPLLGDELLNAVSGPPE